MSKAIRGVPQRDTLVVLGDFNSTLNTSAGVVGTCTPGSPPHRSNEDAYFQRLVQGHGLALNTWSSGSGLTFHTATSKSQIDYILAPKSLARGESKQSKPLTDFQLGRWEKGGHYPVEAKIRPLRHWQLSSHPPPSPPYDKHALEEAVRYNHPKAQAMKEWVADQLSLITTTDMEEVNEVLIKASERYFPRAPKPSSPPQNAMHRATKRMWARLTALDEDLATSTLSPADHETLVKDLSTWHKQAVTRARRQRLADFTQEVDQATQRGNSYLAHKTLQKLRPWRPQPKTQLVNKDGYLMAAEEELKLMQEHAKTVFQRHDRLQFEVRGLPTLSAPLLSKHISSIRPHKAVPQNSASAAAWKLCSDSASEHLFKSTAKNKPARLSTARWTRQWSSLHS